MKSVTYVSAQTKSSKDILSSEICYRYVTFLRSLKLRARLLRELFSTRSNYYYMFVKGAFIKMTRAWDRKNPGRNRTHGIPNAVVITEY